jgi:hypothetical protein
MKIGVGQKVLEGCLESGIVYFATLIRSPVREVVIGIQGILIEGLVVDGIPLIAGFKVHTIFGIQVNILIDAVRGINGLDDIYCVIECFRILSLVIGIGAVYTDCIAIINGVVTIGILLVIVYKRLGVQQAIKQGLVAVGGTAVYGIAGINQLRSGADFEPFKYFETNVGSKVGTVVITLVFKITVSLIIGSVEIKVQLFLSARNL